jgi:hypothetical protein
MTEMEPRREYYTNHGLHFNKAGKGALAKSITNIINQIVLSKYNNHPASSSTGNEEVNKVNEVNLLVNELVNAVTRDKTCSTSDKSSSNESAIVVKEPSATLEISTVKELVNSGTSDKTCNAIDKPVPNVIANVEKESGATMENPLVKDQVNEGIRDKTCASLDIPLPLPDVTENVVTCSALIEC